jgi:hypothetical protein
VKSEPFQMNEKAVVTGKAEDPNPAGAKKGL